MKEANIQQRIDVTQLGLPLDQRGYISWRQLEAEPHEVRNIMIEDAGRRLIEFGINLTQIELARNGLSGFASGVSQHYPESFRGLRQSLGLPGLKRPNNYWKNISHIEEEAARALAGGIELKASEFNKAGFGDLTAAILKYYPGKHHGLRQKLGLTTSIRPDGYWTPERIEEQAQSIYKEHGSLTYKLLREIRGMDLVGAINRNYPGGFRALQDRLGITIWRKQAGYWTPEKIEEEYRRFVEENNDSSFTTLKKKNLRLLTAIYRKYPGGYQALREKLGHESPYKPRGYWTVERIEEEAYTFYKQYRALNHKILLESGRKDLIHAIITSYPGSFFTLRTKLGLSQLRRARDYWTSLENIEKEAREWLEQNGNLNTHDMSKKGAGTLIQAIHKYYPGGLKELRKNLGIPEPGNASPLSSDEANIWLMELVREE